jgi:hypothetical protein
VWLKRNTYNTAIGKPEEKGHSQDLGEVERIILEVFQSSSVYVDWI